MTSRRRVRAAIGVALLVGSAAGSILAVALPVCGEPTPSTPTFAAGSTNTLSWSAGSPTGGGFTLEVAVSSVTLAGGSFRDKIATKSVSSSTRSYEFTGLAERTHYYHLRATSNATCTTGPWSEVDSTTQDATGPVVSITTRAPMTPYIMSSVTIRGTASDAPTAPATVASGARVVTVVLQNDIAPLGAQQGDPPRKTASVDVDGTWTVTFEAVKLGMFTATATGYDRLDNPSTEPAVLMFTAVGSPT